MRVGADPELFLKDGSGRFISAVGKFGGTKREPKPLGRLEGCFVQEDNALVEFNIPPCIDRNAFKSFIALCISEISLQARHQGYELAIVPSAEFEDDQLDSEQARSFGCDPDFNVWTMSENPPPSSPNRNLRSAGGHIHLEWSGTDKIGIARAMDLFLGCPSILYDPDLRRRSLYGKAGAVRFKPYGVEYRTLSNFWIAGYTDMIWEQLLQAFNFVMWNSENLGKIFNTTLGARINRCINEADTGMLKSLTKEFGLRY